MHRGSASAGRLGRAGHRMRIRNRYFVARSHQGIGKTGALIVEDLSYAAKHAMRGHFQWAWTQIRGMLAGLKAR